MAKIGDVEVTILKEEIIRENQVTSRMVEDGNIADNIKKMPELVEIKGVVGKDAWPQLQKLKEYDRDGTLLKYVGRNVYTNVVLERFDTSHAAEAITGFTFTATLKQMRLTKSKMVTISVPKAIKPAVKKKTNAGRQTTKKKPVKNNKGNRANATKTKVIPKETTGTAGKDTNASYYGGMRKKEINKGIGLTTKKDITLDKYRMKPHKRMMYK